MIRLDPVFLSSEKGRIFVLLRRAESASACILFIPPFAEEMNKSRRQFTEIAMSLVDLGYATIFVDLYGTGDSEGLLRDASWEHWKHDIDVTMRWAESLGVPVKAIVTTRLGCGLASEALKQVNRSVEHSIFIQPVVSGHQYLNQFLRLRVAASMMEAGAGESVATLREKIAQGESIEVAGYELTPTMAEVIENMSLINTLSGNLGQLSILELGRSAGAELSPASKQLVQAGQSAHIPISGTRIVGEPFWATTEISTNGKLRQLTTDLVLDRQSL